MLRDAQDPELIGMVMDATVGGIRKENGKYRPITITQCVVRCILARAVKRSRNELRGLLEKGN